MDSLSETVLDFVMCEGLACAAGIATIESLAGGPPTADITSVLPEAKSAVSFAIALDQSLIPPFLSKKDRRSYQHDHVRAHVLSSGISFELASYLEQRGCSSHPLNSNNFYRTDASPAGAFDLIPDISLRYLAVASGVGSFGLSGKCPQERGGSGHRARWRRHQRGTRTHSALARGRKLLRRMQAVYRVMRVGLDGPGRRGKRFTRRHRAHLLEAPQLSPLRICLRRIHGTAPIRQMVHMVARPT